MFFPNFKFKNFFQNFGTRLYEDTSDCPKSNFIREHHMHHWIKNISLSHVPNLPPPIQMNINDPIKVIFKNPNLEFVPLVVARCDETTKWWNLKNLKRLVYKNVMGKGSLQQGHHYFCYQIYHVHKDGT